MRGHGYRTWCLVAGVVAGGLIAFGLAIPGAPAREGAAPVSREKEKAIKSRITSEAEREAFSQANAERLAATGVAATATPTRGAVDANIKRAQILPATDELRDGIRWARIGSASAPAGDSVLASGGTVAPGGACTCDSDCCAAAANDPTCAGGNQACRVGNCVGGICVASNAPVNTRCNLDGAYCTDDRCNDAGVCEARKAATSGPGNTMALNRCAKECCNIAVANGPCVDLPTPSSHQNCVLSSDCPGAEACIPKTTGSNITFCDEATDECQVRATPGQAGNPPQGRCCTYPAGAPNNGDGTCSRTTLANCASGIWVRLEDPDDFLHTCDADLGCPKYSSGIAPAGTDGADLGKVVTSPRRCRIGGGICEFDSDCWPRCNGGDRHQESCDTNVNCPGGGVCELGGTGQNLCDDKLTSECNGSGKFVALGDDYALSNTSFLRLKEFRFRGGVEEPNEWVVFDFYNNANPPVRVASFGVRFPHPGIQDYNIIVDCGPDCDGTQPQGPFEETERDPPFVIPAAGYVVARGGVASSLGISQFAGEEDLNFHWLLHTGAANVGGNDTAKMVAKTASGGAGALNFNANLNANNVLQFELVGDKIADPLGACCDRTDGSCADTHQWECRFCTGTGAPCDRDRDCGLSQVQACSTRDWKGPRTAAEIAAGPTPAMLCAGGVCGNLACCIPDNPADRANRTVTVLPMVGGQLITPSFLRCNAGDTLTVINGTAGGILVTCPNGALNAVGAGGNVVCACTAAINDTYKAIPAGRGGIPKIGRELVPVGCQQFSGPTAAADCVAAGGTPNGFGNECTNNCCKQSLTGLDCCKDFGTCSNSAATCSLDSDCPGGVCELDCQGATSGPNGDIHNIAVPSIGTVQVDISGSTSPAVYSDECAYIPSAGWYEMFHLDNCGVVTVNLCCNDPIWAPITRWLEPTCPCTGGNTIFADLDAGGLDMEGFGSACNNSHCCTDGNWSGQFTVPAGTYVYQLFAISNCAATGFDCVGDGDCNDPTVPGVFGDACQRMNTEYQMHLYVEPCPLAACCNEANPADMCSVINKFDCEAGGGEWLGDDDPAVAACLPAVQPAGCGAGQGACCLGACCIGPGDCQDNSGAGVTSTTCAGLSGDFHGGVLCAANPCPICPIEDPQHCQSMNATYIFPSDRAIGERRVDDFRADGASIDRLCWFPCWVGDQGGGTGSFECSGSSGGTKPPDAFRAYLYEDDFGLPGLPIAGTPGAGYWDLNPDALQPSDGGAGSSRCWRYSAPLSPSATVNQGDCYWIGIDGEGEVQTQGRCTVFWAQSFDGNNMSVRDTNGTYEYADLVSQEYAWCVSSGIQGASNPPTSQDGGCGNVPVACCKPGPVCDDTGTYLQCVGTQVQPLNGVAFPFLTCTELNQQGGCPNPLNNDCADATVVCTGQTSDPNLGECTNNPAGTDIDEPCNLLSPDCHWASVGAVCSPRPPQTDAYRCNVPTDNRLATTDGPQFGVTGCADGDAFQSDIWYEYTAPCSGHMSIHMCRELTYDAMLQVFSSNVANEACACTFSPALSRACNDDYCAASGTTSGVELNVTKDACYLIRIGGYSALGSEQDAGQNISEMEIGIICNPTVNVQNALPADAPHNRAKNRYISFKPNPANTNPVKYEVQRVYPGKCINNQADCYTNAQCGGTNTCDPVHLGWVDTPDANGLSRLVPDANKPAARVWTETVVHVGDCEIFPIPENANAPLTCSVGGQPCAAVCGAGQCAAGQGECTPPPAKFRIRATEDNIIFTSGLDVVTVGRPCPKKWGDTVGSFVAGAWDAPNGVVNTNDFLALLQSFQVLPTRPHVTVSDVVGAGLLGLETCINESGNIGDVFNTIKAFQGGAYPAYVCSTSGHGCSNLGAACTAPGVGTCSIPGTTCPNCPPQ
ncbi:MAG: hypothetical protein HY763_00235 [Planctomycetes bacterium]|nr:hypothetical protein [Planctomycetota bacterium]